MSFTEEDGEATVMGATKMEVAARHRGQHYFSFQFVFLFFVFIRLANRGSEFVGSSFPLFYSIALYSVFRFRF